MSLPSGQSELDTVVLRLPDYGQVVTNWSRYQFNRAFLTPTAAWSFALSDEDPTLTSTLVAGARVELVINGLVQCSGRIDRKEITGDADSGTTVTVKGRDILGRVVDATVDPAFKFTAGMTVPQLVGAVLAPFGITKIYNADLFNLSVITGYASGQGSGAQRVVPVQVINLIDDATGGKTIGFTAGGNTLIQSSTRPDLTTLTVQQAKPHAGEGCFAYLNRLLTRLGLTLWAAADGSGVVIDGPTFTAPPQYQIIHRRSDPSQNNVEWGSVVTDLSTQPSCVVAFGFGGGQDVAKTRLKCIMVNELVGLAADGTILPSVATIIARYPGARVLPVRPQVRPLPKPLGAEPPSAPWFLKDDEAHNLDQLAAFTRRKMAEVQSKGVTASYDVMGHTQNGHPWAVNTSVSVTDEVRGFQGTLWVLDVTFTKTPSGGTKASLKLILPYTLQLGEHVMPVSQLEDIFSPGVDVLGTTIDANGTVLAQTGDAVTGEVTCNNAEWWQHVGFASRPPRATPGQPATQAITINSGGADAVIASRDLTGQAIYGNLAEGDTVVYAPGPTGTGQACVQIKGSGAVTLFTTDTNTDAGNGVYLRVDQTKLAFVAPWGSLVFDATGFHINTASGARLDIGTMSVPSAVDPTGLISSLVPSYCRIGAGIVTLDAPTVMLGPSGGLHQAVTYAAVPPVTPASPVPAVPVVVPAAGLSAPPGGGPVTGVLTIPPNALGVLGSTSVYVGV